MEEEMMTVIMPLCCIGVVLIGAVALLIASGTWKPLFRKPIRRDRAEFLNQTFGLTVDELRLLHFDGRFFYFNLSRKQPYEKFESVACLFQGIVRVTNPKIPHTTSWRYTRVDGGPDRRYKNNPRIMTSCKVVLGFRGKRVRKMIAYHLPRSEINTALRKINRLLIAAQVVDLERRFELFAEFYSRYVKLRSSLDKAKKKLVNLMSVLESFDRLSENVMPSDVDLSSKYSAILAERSRLIAAIERIDSKMEICADGMSSVVQDIQLKFQQSIDLERVRKYRPG